MYLVKEKLNQGFSFALSQLETAPMRQVKNGNHFSFLNVTRGHKIQCPRYTAFWRARIGKKHVHVGIKADVFKIPAKLSLQNTNHLFGFTMQRAKLRQSLTEQQTFVAVAKNATPKPE